MTSFLIKSSSIAWWLSWNFGQIPPLTTELAALEPLKVNVKCCGHSSVFISLPKPKAHQVSLLYSHDPASFRCPSRRPQFKTSNSPKSLGQSKPNFMWIGGMKVCSQHLGQMTNIASVPIYGKRPLKIFFSRTNGPISTKHVMWHRRLLPIKACSNNDPGLTLIYLTARSSNFVT